jgi:hypothetical protein
VTRVGLMPQNSRVRPRTGHLPPETAEPALDALVR